MGCKRPQINSNTPLSLISLFSRLLLHLNAVQSPLLRNPSREAGGGRSVPLTQLLLAGTASDLKGMWGLVVNKCSTQPLPSLYISYTLLSKGTCRSLIHSPAEKDWPQPTSATKQKKHTCLRSNQQEGPMLGFSALPAGAPTSQADK